MAKLAQPSYKQRDINRKMDAARRSPSAAVRRSVRTLANPARSRKASSRAAARTPNS
jgi:hypothetical protein